MTRYSVYWGIYDMFEDSLEIIKKSGKDKGITKPSLINHITEIKNIVGWGRFYLRGSAYESIPV